VRAWLGQFRIELPGRPGRTRRGVSRGGFPHRPDRRSEELPPGPDPSAARRLQREFDALRHLHHPNIVRVLDLGEADGFPWLSMEFVDGMPLREWLVVAGKPKLLEPEPEGDVPEGVDLDVLFEEPDSGALLAAARGAAAADRDRSRGDADRRGAGRARTTRIGCTRSARRWRRSATGSRSSMSAGCCIGT